MADAPNKIVFISGSSRGIGAAAARRFAQAGYTIVITYNSATDDAKRVARDCEKLGAPETLILELDITNDESIRNAVRQVKDRYGKIEILVNNAGVFLMKPLAEQSFMDIHNQVAINLEGLMKLTREFLPVVT